MKKGNIIETNVRMRANLELKREVGGRVGKPKSFTDLVRTMGLRILKSDSIPDLPLIYSTTGHMTAAQ